MKKFILPKLYAIISFEKTGFLSTEDGILKYAEALLRSGVKLIQLRCKETENIDFLYSITKKLTDLKNSKFSLAKIIINDYVDIAHKLNADGVHLGQLDTSPSAARKLLGQGKIIGLSTNNLEQAIKADLGVLDYLACGPVFLSKTKSGHAEELGVDGVKLITSTINEIQFVAIGGINIDNFSKVLNSGAKSVAMVNQLKESYQDQQLDNLITAFNNYYC